ncbi:MAG: glycosyltransferase family 1 protein [Ignavibacteriaceae bacterium]
MKIGLYIHHSTIKAGGIFTYSIGVLRLLLSSEDIEKIYLIYSPGIRNELSDIIKHKKIESVEIDREIFYVKYPFMISFFLHDIYLLIKNYFPESNSFNFLKKLSFFINPYRFKLDRINFDILHVPRQHSPVYNLKRPIIITMHDVQELHFPEFFSSQERLQRAFDNKKSIEESKHIIVSFDHIKNDLIKYFRVNNDKVSVCPPPFSSDWFAHNKFTDLNEIKTRYNLKEEFILYPAATWPHKNHLALIEALNILRQKGKNIQLICTGNKKEYFKDVIQKRLIEFNLQEEIKFLGIVPESDLISLYKLTRLVVIPTLYEAGSGPLYEAMRYSIPVICSNVTSLPDTMNNDEFVFNPNDPAEISEMIKKGIADEEFRKRNVENSRLRMEIFSKNDYTSNFINTYKKIINKSS